MSSYTGKSSNFDNNKIVLNRYLTELINCGKYLISTSPIPYFRCKVQAGFPSPADDYIEQYLDLNTFFIAHPSSTIALRATSIGLIGTGVFKGDWLLIDKSLAPVPGRWVVAEVEGELKLLRVRKQQGRVQFLTTLGAILVPCEMLVLGVVILVMHEVN